MILIMALALIVVGPDKLPDLARSLAKGVLELKRTVNALKDDLAKDNPLDAVKPELQDAADSLRDHLGDPKPDGWTGIPDSTLSGAEDAHVQAIKQFDEAAHVVSDIGEEESPETGSSEIVATDPAVSDVLPLSSPSEGDEEHPASPSPDAADDRLTSGKPAC